MHISLPGVLERAADRCESARDWQTRELGARLRDLLKHLREVRADPKKLAEFFELWTDRKTAEAAARKGT